MRTIPAQAPGERARTATPMTTSPRASRLPASAAMPAGPGGSALRSGYACQEAAHAPGRGHRPPDPARRDGPGHRGIRAGRRASAAASARQHLPRRGPPPGRRRRAGLVRGQPRRPAGLGRDARSGSCPSAPSAAGRTRSSSSLSWQRRRCAAEPSLICSMRSPGGRPTTSGSTPCTRRSLISAPPPAGRRAGAPGMPGTGPARRPAARMNPRSMPADESGSQAPKLTG